ncbi:MAG TPA: phosphoribosylformimino-5-aminoimidazole carboxamide ribotide isomerase [Candidatus Mediterraneibacter stercorigallinarum]|uniref:Phosphoribosylformimino-5-aminoimidazole carboxamide ribotide isomerase n=1 Tax=Candidatus Mediterraneibacter stercorigallinarum TaxID=2838686 RepID=A0A9D2IJ51_9FIRM|nr:phosphoribosylformimino-5-aminoimidazole carboxamide ribotide isomerase [Candidatus Mediterraneibacter stercorigallinarum]
MRFRPCIDIHNGKVKQIVGGSLRDKGDSARTNFSSELGADYYAELYKRDGLKGGHIILLNPAGSDYYEATREQALSALGVYPGGMQIGGGITAENAEEYLDAGASHVIVTSYVFRDGIFRRENMERLVSAVGKEHIVLDLSCRKKDGAYYVVTDRWQKFTEVSLDSGILAELSGYCDEFLIHGVDVEGKRSGMEGELVHMLGKWAGIPITYAGGIGTLEDLERFREASGGRVDFTIGSALDLFGGDIPYEVVRRL